MSTLNLKRRTSCFRSCSPVRVPSNQQISVLTASVQFFQCLLQIVHWGVEEFRECKVNKGTLFLCGNKGALQYNSYYLIKNPVEFMPN